MTERILEVDSPEEKKLIAVAKMLEAFSKNGFEYLVADVYFDFKQDWMWTTIISDGAQVLNPKEWKQIISAESTEELSAIVSEIQNDKYFQDR